MFDKPVTCESLTETLWCVYRYENSRRSTQQQEQFMGSKKKIEQVSLMMKSNGNDEATHCCLSDVLLTYESGPIQYANSTSNLRWFARLGWVISPKYASHVQLQESGAWAGKLEWTASSSTYRTCVYIYMMTGWVQSNGRKFCILQHFHSTRKKVLFRQ